MEFHFTLVGAFGQPALGGEQKDETRNGESRRPQGFTTKSPRHRDRRDRPNDQKGTGLSVMALLPNHSCVSEEKDGHANVQPC